MKHVSLVLFCLAVFADHALAFDAYRLKNPVEIGGPTISLADLVEGPAVPDDPLFGAPAPGKTGTIKAARIAAAFKKATGNTLAIGTDAAVTVTRRARLIAESDIAGALARVIARDFKIEDPEIRLQIDDASQLAVDERATGTPEISNLRLDPQSLRFEAQMTWNHDALLKADSVPVKGYVTADRLVPVLTRALDKGMTVTADDIRIERRLRASLAGKTVLPLAEIAHQVALMPLVVGDVVTTEHVGKPVLVEKGSLVMVTYEANGLLLTMRGRATESGAMGDVIGFTNPQSKKILFGTVSGDGTLRVTSATTKEARLASGAETATR